MQIFGADNPEVVNSKGLLNRLNKQYNVGRLQEAVGDQSGEDLINHASAAQVMEQFPPTQREVLKTLIGKTLVTSAAKGAGLAGGAGIVYKLASMFGIKLPGVDH
jgi:hypothetical protein